MYTLKLNKLISSLANTKLDSTYVQMDCGYEVKTAAALFFIFFINLGIVHRLRFSQILPILDLFFSVNHRKNWEIPKLGA